MITFKVYALIDSRDSSIFYIGATKMSLHKRLIAHKNSKEKCKAKSSVINKRARRIKEIILSGADVHIKLLKECSPDKVDHYEEKYYNIHINNGFELLQNKSHFNLSKKRWLNANMIRFVSRIDDVTNKRFEDFCESINLQSSTALRILINEALNAREKKLSTIKK